MPKWSHISITWKNTIGEPNISLALFLWTLGKDAPNPMLEASGLEQTSAPLL